MTVVIAVVEASAVLSMQFVVESTAISFVTWTCEDNVIVPHRTQLCNIFALKPQLS